MIKTVARIRLIATTGIAALALTGCNLPFGATPTVPAALRPASELPNRALMPAIGIGGPSGNPGPAASGTATPSAPAATVPPVKQAEKESDLRFCAHRADFKPAAPVCAEPATAFPAGLARVNGVWTVTAWPGASLSGRWYLNGRALADPPGARTRALCWDGKPESLGFTRTGPQFVSLAAASLGVSVLAQGAYRFELYADGKLILASGFGVGAPGSFDAGLIAAAPTGGVAKTCGR